MKKRVFIFLSILFLLTPTISSASSKQTEANTGLEGTITIGDEQITFTNSTKQGIQTITATGENSFDVIVYDQKKDEVFVNGNKIEQETIEGLRELAAPSGLITPQSEDPGGGSGGPYTLVGVTPGSINILGLTVGAIAGVLSAAILKGATSTSIAVIAGAVAGSVSDGSWTIDYKRYKYYYYSNGWKYYKYNCLFYNQGRYITNLVWTTSNNL